MKHSNNTKYEKLPQTHASKELNGETTGSPDSGSDREVSTVKSRSADIDYWITVGFYSTFLHRVKHYVPIRFVKVLRYEVLKHTCIINTK